MVPGFAQLPSSTYLAICLQTQVPFNAIVNYLPEKNWILFSEPWHMRCCLASDFSEKLRVQVAMMLTGQKENMSF